MSPGIPMETRSLRALRWRARAPRVALLATLCLFALIGLRSAVAGPPAPAKASRSATGSMLGPGAFAEEFARAYLSFDPARPELRDARLKRYLSRSMDADAGLRPEGAARSVGWTAVVAERWSGDVTTVTVAAGVGEETLYLAVPVRRDARGFLAITAPPALVGAPATNPAAEQPAEREVEDGELRAVCERAVANYLAGDRRDLAADLADGAVVSLPSRRLRVRSTDAITWVPGSRRRVAVLVEAADEQRNVWTLRYELGVVRGERWLVRSLAVNPTAGGR